MAQHYALTLDLLLRVLQAHLQTYQIGAMIPAEILPALKNKATRGTQCQVSIVVEQGQVVSCLIRDQQERVLLEGAKAVACIQSCEQVVWAVQTPQTTELLDVRGVSSEPLSSFASPLPKRPWSLQPPPYLKHALDAQQFAAVSRKQRLTLILLDGKRSVSDLCILLHMPREQVEAVLGELEALGFITTALPGNREQGRG